MAAEPFCLLAGDITLTEGDQGLPSASVIAGWWGAIVATLAFAWNVIVWVRSGPRLSLEVHPGRALVGDPLYEDRLFISCRVRNLGDRPTTIENLIGHWYGNPWRLFWRKPNRSFVVKPDPRMFPIPHLLGPGEMWNGLMEQDKDVERFGDSGYFYCEVHHSTGRRPVRARIRIPKESKKENLPEAWKERK